MPLFEYRCGACGRRSEELVLAGDAATAPACPACGAAGMTRLLSTFAAHGSHKAEGGADLCGEGACPTPDACGTGACGMGGFGGDWN